MYSPYRTGHNCTTGIWYNTYIPLDKPDIVSVSYTHTQTHTLTHTHSLTHTHTGEPHSPCHRA